MRTEIHLGYILIFLAILESLWPILRIIRFDFWQRIPLPQKKAKTAKPLKPKTPSMSWLKVIFYALTAHFGQWEKSDDGCKPIWQVATELLYGQVKKIVCRRRLMRVEHSMLWG